VKASGACHFLFVVAVAFSALACGEGVKDPGPSVPIDRTKTVKSLSDTELALFCDWETDRLGGYNHRTTCNGVWVMTKMNQMACETMTASSPCKATTVGEIEDCVNAVKADLCGGIPLPCLSLMGC
jgi:hypothetical protein